MQSAKLPLLLLLTLALGNVALKHVLKIRANPRPALALLERWYAAQPMRRRICGAIPNWDLGLGQTQAIITTLQSRFKLLRCTVDDNLVWMEENPSPYIQVHVSEEEEDWETCAQVLLSENPEAMYPLVRVCLNVRRKYLVVMMDHVLTDGQGFAYFMESLMQLANGGGEGDTESGDFPMPAEHYLNLSLSPWQVFQRLVLAGSWKAKPGEEFFAGPITSQSPAPQRLPGPCHTLVHSFSLPNAHVVALRERCRERNTTVNALISAAAAQALARLHSRDIVCKLQIPVSIRRDFNVFGGNFVAPFEMEFKVKAGGGVAEEEEHRMWGTAQSIRQALARELPTVHKHLGLLAVLPDFRKYQQSRQDKFAAHGGRTATIEVSNLGVRMTPAPSRWFFAQGNHYLGPLFDVNVVTISPQVEMNCTITASSSAVNKEQVGEFANLLLQQLITSSSIQEE